MCLFLWSDLFPWGKSQCHQQHFIQNNANMCAKQHYLSYNNTEFSPDIAEYNLETKDARQKKKKKISNWGNGVLFSFSLNHPDNWLSSQFYMLWEGRRSWEKSGKWSGPRRYSLALYSFQGLFHLQGSSFSLTYTDHLPRLAPATPPPFCPVSTIAPVLQFMVSGHKRGCLCLQVSSMVGLIQPLPSSSWPPSFLYICLWIVATQNLIDINQKRKHLWIWFQMTKICLFTFCLPQKELKITEVRTTGCNVFLKKEASHWEPWKVLMNIAFLLHFMQSIQVFLLLRVEGVRLVEGWRVELMY